MFVSLRAEPFTIGGEIASGQITRLDHSSLKPETLRGRTLTEIHELLQKVYSDSKLDHSLISHLSQRFCQGQGNVNNKECTGRLRTSTVNTTAAIIATVLEEDRYMTVNR